MNRTEFLHKGVLAFFGLGVASKVKKEEKSVLLKFDSEKWKWVEELPVSSANFLRGDGTWVKIEGSTSSKGFKYEPPQ